MKLLTRTFALALACFTCTSHRQQSQTYSTNNSVEKVHHPLRAVSKLLFAFNPVRWQFSDQGREGRTSIKNLKLARISSPVMTATAEGRKAKQSDEVIVKCTTKLGDGTVIDEDKIMIFRIGSAEFPVIGAALTGMEIGEQAAVTLTPEQAYGNYDRSKVKEIPGWALVNPQVGQKLITKLGAGVVKSIDDSIEVDYNHPLAGKTLTYDIHLMKINRGKQDYVESILDKSGGPVQYCGEEVMAQKAHGTSDRPVQDRLLWDVDNGLADRICNFNRHAAERSGYWKTTRFPGEVAHDKQTVFYDSVSGKPLYVAPIGRTMKDFLAETESHGWPSFRDEEVIWENVRVLEGSGEVVSVSGTHLGHNLPDGSGNRHCINLVSVAGQPSLGESDAL